MQVKEKFGRLTVYISAPDGTTWNALKAELRRLADASERTCEACGRPGYPWYEEERAAVAQAIGRRVTRWRKTLCRECGWRYYAEGARRWAEVRGEWTPPTSGGWSPERDAEDEDG